MLDDLIIGGGIVGSWIALHCARLGRRAAVADASEQAGDGITGRNSGVLHAGLYYPPVSRKARHCIRGHVLALEFAEKHGVPFELCGKLITVGRTQAGIANSNSSAGPVGNADARQAALAQLEALYANARASGVSGLELMPRPGERFPGVCGELALHSPRTGVIDAARYLAAVRAAAEAAGAMFLPGRRFVAGAAGRAELQSVRDGGVEIVQAAHIYNAAGLHADEVAHAFGVEDFEVRPNRGEYYRLARPAPFRKLVYPLPARDSTAFGVHYTFHVNGEAYAGPNSVSVEHKNDYRILASRAEFHASLARILEGYQPEDLQPGYAGLRPRLFRRGEPCTDFVLHEAPRGVLHLLGVESPGLTAAASLAEEAALWFTK